MELQQEQVEQALSNLVKKGALRRNSLCPCKSGLKVKNCHKQLLVMRHKVVQREIDISNQLARYHEKTGQRLSREKLIESMENDSKGSNV